MPDIGTFLCQWRQPVASRVGENRFEAARTEMAGKGVTLRPPPPLRTVHESFPSHGSSLSKAQDWTR